MDAHIEFINELFDYKNFLKYSNTLIETGCAWGDGVQRALDAGFKKVISIEASNKYFIHSKSRFNSNVSILLGESKKVLPKILKGKPLVFFLDAHPSATDSYGYTEWAATQANIQDNIIKAELGIILADYNKHIIIIDDMQGLDEFSQRYIDMILKVNSDYQFKFYDENLSGNKFYKSKILAAIT